MKKVVAVALLLNTILLVVLTIQILPLQARAGSDTALTDSRFCTDANGDGKLDIGDIITLCNYVFKTPGSHFPEPYCIAEGYSLQKCMLCPEERTYVSVSLDGQTNIPRYEDPDHYQKYTTLRLDTENADVLGEFNPQGSIQNGIDPWTFKASQDGVYLVSLRVVWTDPNQITVREALNVRGSSVILYGDQIHGGNTYHESTRILTLSKDDTVSTFVTHFGPTNDPDIAQADLKIVRLF